MTGDTKRHDSREASFFWRGIGKKLACAFAGSALAAGLVVWWLDIGSINGFLGCFIAIHLILMYCIGVMVIREDKSRAATGAWRVPESTILVIAAAGGGIGVLRAMYKYHHKTRHAKFYLGVPFILFVQANILLYLFFPGPYSRLVHFVT